MSERRRIEDVTVDLPPPRPKDEAGDGTLALPPGETQQSLPPNSAVPLAEQTLEVAPEDDNPRTQSSEPAPHDTPGADSSDGSSTPAPDDPGVTVDTG